MPIFPFPLDEEERKRRMLTPPNIPPPTRTLPPPPRGIPGEIPGGPMMGVPGSSPLPESPSPRGMALPSPGVPGGEKYGIPGVRASRPPSRYDELAEMKGAYMSGTPGRGKSALTGALEGFMGGGGLAGAATGAAYGAIDPRRLRERQFERYERPGILERFAFEDVDRARARQAEEDALEDEYRRNQIEHLKSEAEKNRRPVLPPRREPKYVPGRGLWDPETGRYIPDTAPPPKEERRPDALEATIDPESGLSAEEMARKSYEARGGDQYVLSKLPERTRRILQEGSVTRGGKTRSATTAERDSAQREFERAIERQLNADKDYTRGNIRAKRVGGRNPQAGNTGIARPRSQFNSKKFPGLKFD